MTSLRKTERPAWTADVSRGAPRPVLAAAGRFGPRRPPVYGGDLTGTAAGNAAGGPDLRLEEVLMFALQMGPWPDPGG